MYLGIDLKGELGRWVRVAGEAERRHIETELEEGERWGGRIIESKVTAVVFAINKGTPRPLKSTTRLSMYGRFADLTLERYI